VPIQSNDADQIDRDYDNRQDARDGTSASEI
jgi:hypothetical protein